MGTVATTQRSRAARPGTKKKPAQRKRAAPPPSFGDRVLRALGHVLAGHARDLGGLVCVALGVVAGMGIYADAAGPVGRALDTGFGTAVGWGRLLSPVLLVVVGVLLFRSRQPFRRL